MYTERSFSGKTTIEFKDLFYCETESERQFAPNKGLVMEMSLQLSNLHGEFFALINIVTPWSVAPKWSKNIGIVVLRVLIGPDKLPGVHTVSRFFFMNVNKFFSSVICIQSSVFLEKFDRQPQGWIVGNSNEICTRFRKICIFDNNDTDWGFRVSIAVTTVWLRERRVHPDKDCFY